MSTKAPQAHTPAALPMPFPAAGRSGLTSRLRAALALIGLFGLITGCGGGTSGSSVPVQQRTSPHSIPAQRPCPSDIPPNSVSKACPLLGLGAILREFLPVHVVAPPSGYGGSYFLSVQAPSGRVRGFVELLPESPPVPMLQALRKTSEQLPPDAKQLGQSKRFPDCLETTFRSGRLAEALGYSHPARILIIVRAGTLRRPTSATVGVLGSDISPRNC